MDLSREPITSTTIYYLSNKIYIFRKHKKGRERESKNKDTTGKAKLYVGDHKVCTSVSTCSNRRPPPAHQL